MKKVDKTVLKETKFIAASVLIFSALMQSFFLIIRMWDYTVLLGNLLSGTTAVLNFFLMGLTVQNAVLKTEENAKKSIKLSQSLRTLMLFCAAALGVGLPCFNVAASLIPLFFPRIAIAFRPLVSGKGEDK